MNPRIFSMDRKVWLWPAIIFFIILELTFRMKIGSVFALAAGWLMLHQWLLQQTGRPRPSDNFPERIIISLYYAVIIAFSVFITFGISNIIARSINNEWMFFRFP